MNIQIIKNKRRKKSISIEVISSDAVRLRVPYRTGQNEINAVLSKYEDWIKDRMSSMSPRELVIKKHGGTWHIPFQGTSQLLEFRYTARKYDRIIVDNNRLIYETSKDSSIITIHDIKKQIKKTYRSYLLTIITPVAKQLSDMLQSSYESINIKNTRSIWGSCRNSKYLTFNIALACVPPDVLHYVVVHEVCHLIYPHHKQSFWRCVERFDPNYSEHRQWLRSHNYLVTVFNN
ncbi:M48 family metallopeptidase [candidate division WWE3 bacterium]|nr:M48 family metallopeptidase [candidate division WWE3 bacterium]